MRENFCDTIGSYLIFKPWHTYSPLFSTITGHFYAREGSPLNLLKVKDFQNPVVYEQHQNTQNHTTSNLLEEGSITNTVLAFFLLG